MHPTFFQQSRTSLDTKGNASERCGVVEQLEAMKVKRRGLVVIIFSRAAVKADNGRAKLLPMRVAF